MDNKLEALQKIIEVGSFTKAAEILGYTQSAISQMISSLEKEMSIKLLYRSKRGVQLTPEGEEVYPFIQKLLTQQILLSEKVTQINHLESGVVRIGAYASISRHWLPKIIKQFQAQYPKVKFVIHQGDYTTITQWISNGEVDFGFISPDAPSGYESELVVQGKFVAVLPKPHRLSQQVSVTLQDLQHESLLLIEEGNFSEPLEAFRQQQLEVDVKIWAHDDDTVAMMVQEGLGVSILPELVLQGTNYQVDLKPLQPTLYRKVGIIKKDDNSLPIASKYFIDLIHQNINSLKA